MGSKVLSGNLGEAFMELVERSSEVRFASAWVTASAALDGLVGARCAVKALVGTHGNATDPSCLRQMLDRIGPTSLRIVGGDGPWFHPKLYLFRGGEDTVAWVGSANFTGAGLGSNREIVLESDDAGVVAGLERWFKREWEELADQDVEAQLSAYRERHSMGAGRLTEVVEPLESQKPTTAGQVARLVFKPAPGRIKGAPYEGEVVVTSMDGARKEIPYKSTTDALCIVLDRLCTKKSNLLDECLRNRAFQERHRDGTRSLYLAPDRDESKLKDRRSDGIHPRELRVDGQDWWVSRDVMPERVWKMIGEASKIAGVPLDGALL